MNILTSEVFQLPSVPFVMVSSMALIAREAANESTLTSACDSDTLPASADIFASSPSARETALG